MKYTVIANCQSGPIGSLLSGLLPGDRLERLKPIHLLGATDRLEFDRVLSEVDVVVHQPIGPAFREYSIDSVKERFPSKKYISFPSMFFLGYWPWMMYLRKPGGGTLKGVLGDYHDERLVGAYVDRLTLDQAIEGIRSSVLDRSNLEAELLKLRQREESLDVKSVDCIEEQFSKRRLFYVMNHPANYLLIHVATQVASLLGKNIAGDCIEQLSSRSEYLNSLIFPIDPSVIRAFDIQVSGQTEYVSTAGGERMSWDLASYVESSYAIYDGVEDMAGLFSYAIQRRRVMGT